MAICELRLFDRDWSFLHLKLLIAGHGTVFFFILEFSYTLLYKLLHGLEACYNFCDWRESNWEDGPNWIIDRPHLLYCRLKEITCYVSIYIDVDGQLL